MATAESVLHIFWSAKDAGYIAVQPAYPTLSALGKTKRDAYREYMAVLKLARAAAEDICIPLPPDPLYAIYTEEPYMQLATNRPIRKVQASAASAGVGAALAQILIWAVQTQGVAIPDGVQVAITTVVVALAALVAGYLVPLRADEVYGKAGE